MDAITHRSVSLFAMLEQMLDNAKSALDDAEKKRDKTEALYAEHRIKIIRAVLPFSSGTRVSVDEAEALVQSVTDAGTCTYSYMRHNQVVGLMNLVVMLGLR
jgi:hypothetical protein